MSPKEFPMGYWKKSPMSLTNGKKNISVIYGPMSAHVYCDKSTPRSSSGPARDWVVLKRVEHPEEMDRYTAVFAGKRYAHTQRYTRHESAFRYFMEAVRDMVYLWPEPDVNDASG